jgi:hypothetical protein
MQSCHPATLAVAVHYVELEGLLLGNNGVLRGKR